MTQSDSSPNLTASERISGHIVELGDWRGETLAKIRKLILATDPRVIEEWKWLGTPVWSRNGMICTGETYQNIVKLTFAKGALLKDPNHLFNSSLEGKLRRAIDLFEGEVIHESAFKTLIRQAIALNSSTKTKAKQSAKSKD